MLHQVCTTAAKWQLHGGVDALRTVSTDTSMKSNMEANEFPEEIIFEDYIRINSKMLRCMGLNIDVRDNRRDSRAKILERLPTIITNVICIIEAIFQLQWIVDLWANDKDLVTQITTSGISNVVCICKGFRMAYCRESLQSLFEKLDAIWTRTRIPDEICEAVLVGARGTLTFCKWYIIMMLGLGICFALPPLKHLSFQYLARDLANHTYDFSERVFLVRYPFEINSLAIYFVILLQEEFMLFYSALYWVCCDTLFAQLTTHTSLLLEVLRYNIETAAEHEKDENRLKRRVIGFIKRHQELTRICQLIEKIFSPILFATMLLTSINICVNLFELRAMMMEGKFAEALLHIFHLGNIFCQLLVYCVFAERLTQQTVQISNATYNFQWTDKHYKLRVYLQTLIMKSQKPFYCTAYGFFTIGHNRITAIVNRALSFYMMLQTTTQY